MAASTWWPTPAPPSKYFSGEELANSHSYHRVIELVSRSLVVSVAAVMVFLAWLFDASGSGRWSPAAVVAVVVAARFGYSVWLGRYHTSTFGAAGVSVTKVFTQSIAFSLIGVGLALTVWLLYRNWGVGFPELLATPALVTLLAGLDRGVRARAAVFQDVPTEALARFTALADLAEVNCDFRLSARDLLGGPNARAQLAEGVDCVVLNADLLDQPVDVQALVVAHEISHIKRRHHRRAEWLGLARIGMWTLLLGLAADFNSGLLRPEAFSLFGLLGLGFWGVLTPYVSFVQRHFERQADLDSYKILSNVNSVVTRRLHATKFANLDPSFITSLFSPHPPPAQRLEMARRHVPGI